MLSLASVARDTRPGPAAAAGQTTECLNQGQMSKIFSIDVFLRTESSSSIFQGKSPVYS